MFEPHLTEPTYPPLSRLDQHSCSLGGKGEGIFGGTYVSTSFQSNPANFVSLLASSKGSITSTLSSEIVDVEECIRGLFAIEGSSLLVMESDRELFVEEEEVD